MERRAFLRGAGTTLMLPWLASAMPARAAVSSAPRRFVYWFVPNGLMLEAMRPTIVGPSYDLPGILPPIAPLQSRISVLTGLENRASMDSQDSFSTHEQCLAGLLTDKHVESVAGALDADVSVDQYAARVAGTSTPFSSLVLGMDEPYISGGQSNTDTYYSTLSWAGPQTPVAPIVTPTSLFERLFAGTDPTATAEEIERRARLRKSVLDSVADRTAKLQSRLDATDRAKLDQFTTGVRELELRIDSLAELVCPQPDAPEGNLAFPERVAAMNDLIVLALQCDHTRFATFMLGSSTSYTTYPFIGVATDHHSLSHGWAYSDSDRADLVQVQTWQVEQFVDLCTKMAAIPEDGGDLLSNTMVMLVSEFGDSNAHLGIPCPMIVAGGEAGGILQGQHRVYTNRPHADLLCASLVFAGVEPAGFGQNMTEPLDLSS